MQDMEHLRDFKWLELAISYSLQPQQLPKQSQAWPKVVSTIKWNPFQIKLLAVDFQQHNSIVKAYTRHHQYIPYMRSRAYISQMQLFNTCNNTRILMLFLSTSEAHILCVRYSWEIYAHGWKFASKSLKFAPDWWLRMHDYNHKVCHQVGRVECASPKLSEAVSLLHIHGLPKFHTQHDWRTKFTTCAFTQLFPLTSVQSKGGTTQIWLTQNNQLCDTSRVMMNKDGIFFDWDQSPSDFWRTKFHELAAMSPDPAANKELVPRLSTILSQRFEPPKLHWPQAQYHFTIDELK